MVEGEGTREGKPIGQNGKPLHGGIKMYTTIQVLCTLSQIAVDTIPNKDPNITWIYAISRLQIIH